MKITFQQHFYESDIVFWSVGKPVYHGFCEKCCNSKTPHTPDKWSAATKCTCATQMLEKLTDDTIT